MFGEKANEGCCKMRCDLWKSRCVVSLDRSRIRSFVKVLGMPVVNYSYGELGSNVSIELSRDYLIRKVLL